MDELASRLQPRPAAVGRRFIFLYLFFKTKRKLPGSECHFRIDRAPTLCNAGWRKANELKFQSEIQGVQQLPREVNER